MAKELDPSKVWLNMAGGIKFDKKHSEEIEFSQIWEKCFSSQKFKVSVTGVRRWAKDVEKVCGRERKTDVFSGKGGISEERKPRVPSSPPCSHLPPRGIFLHEWLCHTWGTKWSLSLFLWLSLPLPQFLFFYHPCVCAVSIVLQRKRELSLDHCEPSLVSEWHSSSYYNII